MKTVEEYQLVYLQNWSLCICMEAIRSFEAQNICLKGILYIFEYTDKFKILMRKIIYYGDGNLRMKDWIWVKASDLRRRIELSSV